MPHTTSQVLFKLNDMVLELQGLKDVVADAFINDATVTVTLVDKDGTQVVGETWPLTMTYVSASDGIYRATLKDTLTVTLGEIYIAQVSANGGAGLQGRWDLPIAVKERKFS